MRYTDDPAADYDAYCLEQEAAMESLPRCEECGQRIEDECCYVINDEPICETCIEQYKVFTTDLMG